MSADSPGVKARAVADSASGRIADDEHVARHAKGEAMTSEMTPYDSRAWTEIEQWRDNRLTARTRQFIPARIRTKVSDAGENARAKFGSLPGAERFEELFINALGGLVDLGSRTAMASVRDGAIIAAYKKHGHDVGSIDDIGKLMLQDIDKVKPNLALAYTAAATAEGAAAGFAISGGEIVATGGSILGVGAGGAPGVGLVAGVMAADAAAVLVAANRSIAHTAAYYGYDLDHPDERLFAVAVLSMGTAAQGGKAAAYIEINKLVQALARRATWQQLRENVVTRVIEKVFTRLGFRITQRKLGQAVPVVGTLIGAGMNARLLSSITDDADHVYRERFLRERYGLTLGPTAGRSVDATDVLDIEEILQEEIADGVATSGDDDLDARPSHAEMGRLSSARGEH